jgi:alcohol dehydrogenase (cytochrome c)
MPKASPEQGRATRCTSGRAGRSQGLAHACGNPNAELLYASVQGVGATATRRRRAFKERIP